MRLASRHDCTVVLVGDCKVGKTSIASRFRTGKFDAGYTRTGGFESSCSSILMEDKRIKFTIHDTSGNHHPSSSRETVYREADVFLLCYRISDPSSLFSAINHWVPELRHHAPATPLLLVGCQADLRGDRGVWQALGRQGRSPVSGEQARSFSNQIEALAYLETSAKMSVAGVQEVFQLAAKISLQQCQSQTSASFQLSSQMTKSSNGQTLERKDQYWNHLNSTNTNGSSSSFPRSASLSSSLNSTRSSLSLPHSLSPLPTRRCSLSLRSKPVVKADSVVMIRCQRLNEDRIYEEVEIEVPAPIYETLQASNHTGISERHRRKDTLGSKLKNLFIRD